MKAKTKKEKEFCGTILYHATIWGYTQTVALLLDLGADIEARDKFNWTPLQIASNRDYPKTVALLRKRGAR